jgi:hypothetical protein
MSITCNLTGIELRTGCYNWKGYGRKRSWSVLSRHLPAQRKITKNVSQNNLSQGQDLNPDLQNMKQEPSILDLGIR